jgi:hypothetical protein
MGVLAGRRQWCSVVYVSVGPLNVYWVGRTGDISASGSWQHYIVWEYSGREAEEYIIREQVMRLRLFRRDANGVKLGEPYHTDCGNGGTGVGVDAFLRYSRALSTHPAVSTSSFKFPARNGWS